MRTRWIWEGLRKVLVPLLQWVNAKRDVSDSARKDKSSVLLREVHVPTPLVTAFAAAVLFFVLLPEVGITPSRIVALFGLLSLCVAFFVLYFRYDLPQFVNDDEAVFLTGLSIVVGVLLIELARAIPHYSPYAVPIGAIAIVVTMLLHVRLALLICMLLSLVTGVLNDFSFNAILISFFTSGVAMLAAQKVRQRGDLYRAGFHVAWVAMATLYGLSLFYAWPWKTVLLEMRWALMNGALCAVIPLGLLPILETFFSRVTSITLLEVGDFNQPLLRRLMLEAPGTYHHTLQVSAIAEQAAEAIGANSLLCRVGMYYHDIGKLVHPEYFIENQTTRRSAKDKSEHHDKLNPSISSLVIMSHVKEGVALAHAYNVPEEIVKFIPEHHGTSLIKYFYMRALEQGEGEEGAPAAETYRYPGPKPASRETVIAMLADSVEAASRTLEEPTYERLHTLVEKIVNGKFMDGQFDDSPVTLQDLRKIIKSFAQSLSAIYHVRIEYPEMASDSRRMLPPEA